MKHIIEFNAYNEGIISSLFKNKVSKVTKISNDDIIYSYLPLLDELKVKNSLRDKEEFFLYSKKYSDLTASFFTDDFEKDADDFINSGLKDFSKYDDNTFYPYSSFGYNVFHIEFNKNDISVDTVLELLNEADIRIRPKVKELAYFLGFNSVFNGEQEGDDSRISKDTTLVKSKFKSIADLKLAINKYAKNEDYEYFSIYKN